MNNILEKNKLRATEWFTELRNSIVSEFQKIENEFAGQDYSKIFKKKSWERPGGGGGEMSVMYGNVFDSVGVNISTVFGEFDEKFAKEIAIHGPNKEFWASGISLVAHMNSPHVPVVHMNTRLIITAEKLWFGGGSDLTPVYPTEIDTANFHSEFKHACDKHNAEYYQKFKKWCDEYFYLQHRNEPRGVGGIFYDYLNSGNFEDDFEFTKDVGRAFLSVYPRIVRRSMYKSWSKEEYNDLLIKRGRYVEFNLLYDRGTRFGLMTGGNIEAILMSLPPSVRWHKEKWENLI